MKLAKVCEFLMSTPYADYDGSQRNIKMRCPHCGDSDDQSKVHFYVLAELSSQDVMVTNCFRAKCNHHGFLTTDVLRKMGCNDPAVLVELANHNRSISSTLDNSHRIKANRDYRPVNLALEHNAMKLKYVNARLGQNFDYKDLSELKIQLNFNDFVRLNSIYDLPQSPDYVEVLSNYTVGFISIHGDYLVCRDITKRQVTKRRYHICRLTKNPEMDDTKMYLVPTTVDLMAPDPTIINVAEGQFSILGAMLGTEDGRDATNVLWVATCGSDFVNGILHIIRQWGFTDCRINVWADSEIKLAKYQYIYKTLSSKVRVVEFVVHYNVLGEDFGQPANNIKIEKSTIKELK